VVLEDRRLSAEQLQHTLAVVVDGYQQEELGEAAQGHLLR
jgi:hypothetical protein